jgi:2-iminobutanoate/2-iminopropanoate deaminase
MKTTLLLILILFVVTISNAQDNKITKKKIHYGKFDQQDTTAGYAEAVLVDNTLYISGAIGRGTVAEQLQSLYSQLDRTLKAYGLTFQNVVKENLYTLDIEEVKKNNSVRKKFYNGDFPAATWVQISRLYTPSAQIEVELIAVLPKKASKP